MLFEIQRNIVNKEGAVSLFTTYAGKFTFIKVGFERNGTLKIECYQEVGGKGSLGLKGSKRVATTELIPTSTKKHDCGCLEW